MLPGRDRARRRATITSHDSPTSSARVVRSFRSSAANSRLTRRAPGLAGQLEEDLLERRPLDASSSCRTTPFAAASSPTRSGGALTRRAAPSPRACTLDSARRPAATASRVRIGDADDRRPRRHRLDVGHRRLPHEPAAMDDHDLVDGLRDLGEHVARDEDRPALARERAEEVAQPADALRIEAVRRLVEHEHLRDRRAAPLRDRAAAACRASSPSRAAGRRSVSSTRSSTSSTRDLGIRPATASTRRWFRPDLPGMRVERLEQRRRPGATGRRASRYGTPRIAVLARGRMDEPEDRPHAWSTFRRRSGRGSR